MKNKPVVVIAGPTASGKSRLALETSKAIDGVVVNADSMQVYKGIPVISACPTAAEKAEVPHVLYEMWDASFNGSVADWLAEAETAIRRIWDDGRIPVVTGGTGLYLDNLINGTSPIPETKGEVREKVAQMLGEEGVNRLHARLAQIDREAAERLSPNDTTRVRRALEVFFDTGKTLSEWHRMPMIRKLPEAVFETVKIMPNASELDERCFRRFDMMVEEGAVEEVRTLMQRKLNPKLPAMRALGVPELGEYVAGRCTLEEAVRLGKLHTRQYAKRQRTWFNHRFEAWITVEACYNGQKEILENVIKGVKK